MCHLKCLVGKTGGRISQAWRYPTKDSRRAIFGSNAYNARGVRWGDAKIRMVAFEGCTEAVCSGTSDKNRAVENCGCIFEMPLQRKYGNIGGSLHLIMPKLGDGRVPWRCDELEIRVHTARWVQGKCPLKSFPHNPYGGDKLSCPSCQLPPPTSCPPPSILVSSGTHILPQAAPEAALHNSIAM